MSVPGPCELDDPKTISVDLRVSGTLSQGRGQPDFSAFGMTAGQKITVFYDKVHDYAAWYGVPESEVLALVLIHELGHALLGPGHVAGETVMMARPTANHVRSFSAGQLRFTAKQVEFMQSAVCARATASSPGANSQALRAP